MKVLLVSTYELGHQPIHVASPAAALRDAGHNVIAVDLAVSEFDPSVIADADVVAISVPMHTAMRLAVPLATQIRAANADLPVAFYGLYAGVGYEPDRPLVDARITGEYETNLVAWIESASPRSGNEEFLVDIGSTEFRVPDRSVLADSPDYARLEWNGSTRKAAAVEASHGCRHRCTHCPIPPVYDGRMRVVGADVVLEDLKNLAASGVEHVSFGDPDFLNAPRYSMDLLRKAHRSHPEMTFDVTVKVEHILKHRELWNEMQELGVLFVVSAFESVDPVTLEILEKDHTVGDMTEALSVLRAAGIHVRPTWLPFMPWTKQEDIVGLVEFIDQHELWAATDPVQLSIKLLVPEGSLLESHPAMRHHIGLYDPAALTWQWSFSDPGVELMQKELESIAASASDCGQETPATLAEMREKILTMAGQSVGVMPEGDESVPRLTESWFCCAEPTQMQNSAVSISLGRVQSSDQ